MRPAFALVFHGQHRIGIRARAGDGGGELDRLHAAGTDLDAGLGLILDGALERRVAHLVEHADFEIRQLLGTPVRAAPNHNAINRLRHFQIHFPPRLCVARRGVRDGIALEKIAVGFAINRALGLAAEARGALGRAAFERDVFRAAENLHLGELQMPLRSRGQFDAHVAPTRHLAGRGFHSAADLCEREFSLRAIARPRLRERFVGERFEPHGAEFARPQRQRDGVGVLRLTLRDEQRAVVARRDGRAGLRFRGDGRGLLPIEFRREILFPFREACEPRGRGLFEFLFEFVALGFELGFARLLFRRKKFEHGRLVLFVGVGGVI